MKYSNEKIKKALTFEVPEVNVPSTSQVAKPFRECCRRDAAVALGGSTENAL